MTIAVSLGEVPALSTRDDLIAEVRAELNRADLTDGEIKSFIRRFEARANRLLRTPEMEQLDSVLADQAQGVLPTDFLEMRRVVGPSGYALDYVSPVNFIDYRDKTPVYTLAGNAIHFAPAPTTDTLFSLLYWAKIPALTADQPTNWLLERHPDAYFYGTLVNAETRIANDDRAVLWKAALDECFAEIEAEARRNSTGMTPRMRAGVHQTRGARA